MTDDEKTTDANDANDRADAGGGSDLPTPVFGSGQSNSGDSAGSGAAPAAVPPATPPAPPAAPQYQPPPQQPYGASPVYAGAPIEPTQVMMGRLFGRTIWMITLLGGILLLIGVILISVANSDEETMIKAGRVLSFIGAFIIGAPMIIAGAYNEETNPQVRYGLIVGGAIMFLAIAIMSGRFFFF